MADLEVDVMRLVIEIDRSADGRYEGTVLSSCGPVPVAFSGTLELLKVLEDTTSVTIKQTAGKQQDPETNQRGAR